MRVFDLYKSTLTNSSKYAKYIHTKQYFIYLSCLGFSDIEEDWVLYPRITSGEIVQLMDLKGVFFLLSPYFTRLFKKIKRNLFLNLYIVCYDSMYAHRVCPGDETDGLILLEIILKVSAILPVHCGQP